MNLLKRIILVQLFSHQALAAVYDPILEQIKPDVVTILGETHKKVESLEVFQNLALGALKRYHCVVVGMEIASDQQAMLDRILAGNASVDTLALWPAVDHPAYRHLIDNLAALKRQGHCIKLVALDSGLNNTVDRDLWMAAQLRPLVGAAPVLVLLGSLHTLKKVDWTVKSGRPSVAEILVNQGIKVNTFPQHWQPDHCLTTKRRTGRFVDAASPEALVLLNTSLMALINAKPHKAVTEVVDGFWVWECH